MTRHRIAAAALALAVVLMASGHEPVAQQPAQPAAGAISGTGLLPIYGVDLAIDPGTDGALAKSFEPLAPLGFGVVRFAVDVRDGGAAGRVAQLCVWAAEKGVKIVPVLTGANEGEAIGPAFAAQSAGFVTALFQTLSGFQPSRAEAYQQIVAFQIERAMNDAPRHGNMPRETALLRLLQAAGAIRKAEQAAAAEAGINATPLMIEVSFDAELKAAGIHALMDFTDAAYASAVAPLAAFVGEAAASADIDLIALEYLDGPVGGGTADDLARLVRDAAAAAPGKKIVAVTGSAVDAAFPDDRKKFYALAFANLADHRASEGPDSALLGVIFRWADDDDAKQALAKIAESVSQANATTPPAEQVPEDVAAAAADASAGAESGGDPALVTAAKEKVQQFLLGLLDRSLEKLSTNVMSSGEGDTVSAPVDPGATPASAPADPAAIPQLVITEMKVTPSKPVAGKPVQIEALVYNKSETAVAEGLTAAIVDDTGGVLNADTMPTDLLITPAGNRMVQLTWLPLVEGPQKIGIVIADASLNELAKSSYTAVAVAPQQPLEIAKTIVPAGSSARVPQTPLGFPVVTQLKPGVLSQVIVSMRNPYRKSLSATSITISAAGLKPVTKTMPYMAPGQTRSLTFPGMAFSGAGEREMRLTLKSGARSATVTSRMLLPAVKPVMAAPANRQAKTPVRSVLPSAPARAVTPPRKPAMTRVDPPSAPPPPIRATPEKAAPPPQRNQPPPPIMAAPERNVPPPVRVARPDLAIVGASASSQATRNGQVVTVKVEIRNVGNAPAQGAQLACGASGSSRSLQALGVIGPGQMRVATCQVQLRSAGAAQIGVTVSAPGDANGSNNQRVLALQPARRR